MTTRTLASASACLLGCQIALSAAQIGFEPNKGQFAPQYAYSARTAAYQLDLGTSESHLSLHQPKGSLDLTWRLRHANASARWESSEPMASTASYFRGSNPAHWQTGVPMFARVRQRSVYPGIDLLYYGNPNKLEYDFVVSPGADPCQIRLQFTGARDVSVDASGNLVLQTATGQVIQNKPLVYQTINGQRREVAGSFVLHRNREVSFQVARYDRSAPLTIDPILGVASFLGGSDLDQGNAVAVDNAGNMYITGVTYSNNGSADVLIRKFAPGGTQVWKADLGGNSDDFGQAIKVGTDGSVYVTGRTSSDNFPVQSAFQRARINGTDAFLLRLNSNGQSLIFSTYLGGSGDDQARSIALDSSGAVYVTGTAGREFPFTGSVFQPSTRGGKDAFIAKFDNLGNPIYSTLLGGSDDDEGTAIAVDTRGNAYVTGTTSSDNFPQVNNPFQHSQHGDVDAFVVELNPTGGNLIYSTFLGGRGSDQPFGIAVDSNGSAYIAGKTGSRDFPTTNNVYQGDYNGGDNDIFVTRFTAGQGGLIYSTLIGTDGNDEGFALATDSDGNAYVAGNTDSNNYPVTRDATQARRAGNRDAVVTILDPQGSRLIFSTYMGGSFNDAAYGIAVDSSRNVYVTGVTSSADFPAIPGSFQEKAGGNGSPDAFFAELVFAQTSGAPTINNNGVVNGANFIQGPLAPGSVASLFGTNFVPTPFSANRLPLPTSLGGVSVLVNGVAAPLYYVGINQINFQVPVDLAPGRTTVAVQTANGQSLPAVIQVNPTAPALLQSNGHAVAVNQDGSINSASRPAKVGSFVTVYFTGIGAVSGPLTSGGAAPVATSVYPSSVTIAGANANASYVGLSPGSAGLAQANIQVPSVSSGDQVTILTIGGVSSPGATISVTQ